LNTVTII